MTLVRDEGLYGLRFWRWYVKAKDTRKHPLLFSEREGCVRTVQIGHWAFNCRRIPA